MNDDMLNSSIRMASDEESQGKFRNEFISLHLFSNVSIQHASSTLASCRRMHGYFPKRMLSNQKTEQKK